MDGKYPFSSDICMQNCIYIQDLWSSNKILWRFPIIYDLGVKVFSVMIRLRSFKSETLLQICAKLKNVNNIWWGQKNITTQERKIDDRKRKIVFFFPVNVRVELALKVIFCFYINLFSSSTLLIYCPVHVNNQSINQPM